MKQKVFRFLLGLALCAAMLAYSALSLTAVGKDLQYLVPAPALEAAYLPGPATLLAAARKLAAY